MRIIAITGGIGSGKSVVSQLLRVMGHAVYDCDREAKRLMESDATLRAALTEAFGQECYTDGKLNRPYLASCIFGNPEKLRLMNSIVHPAVARDFLQSGITFVESAILFEAGFDQMIHPAEVWCVAAPLELRLARAMERDHASRQVIEARIGSQLEQEEKISRSKQVIWNDMQHSVIEQVQSLCSSMINSTESGESVRLK